MHFAVVFFVLLSSGYSEIVQAHGGGLDASGCHNNRKTGEYHCHRGPSETRPTNTQEPQSAQPTGSSALPYNRNLYGFKTYPVYSSRGFYTGQSCQTSIDHVVSLKDAHDSGAGRWSSEDRIAFANDRFNHVPACRNVNSSKGPSTPREFIRKSNDHQGIDYQIKTKCAYLGIYYQVKLKYQLSFRNNDEAIFKHCGLDILDSM